jgi:hypothetical protein
MQSVKLCRPEPRLFVVAFMAMIILALPAYSQNTTEDKVSVGAFIGVQADTSDDTAFAFGFYGDYYITQNLSVGPLF